MTHCFFYQNVIQRRILTIGLHYFFVFLSVFRCVLSTFYIRKYGYGYGDAENAGVEKAGVEKAGVEKSGVDSRGGICRSGKCGSR